MSRPLQFPYGIADFRRIRREGMVYVDRTAHIRDLESLGSTLVFLRPRRFGKSLWLQTMATYYDLRYAERFDEIFSGLDIASGRGPTPLKSRFFVLQWNFSLIKPRGSVEEIAAELRNHVRDQVEAFVSDYEPHLPAPVRTDGTPQSILISLLSVIRKTPYKLYLLIDEYDNFVNEVMVKDVATYKALFEADGPYKELMKAVKNATEGLGLERVFVTGVSPVALNDLTSGFNTATDVSREPELARLCGFDESESGGLLERVAEDLRMSREDIERYLDVMRVWYNGYRFSEDARDLVYNPTNVLYFLDRLKRRGEPPKQLHDANLRTDQTKLAFLARSTAGKGVIEELSEGHGEIRILELLDAFSLGELTAQLAEAPDAVASFLYYLGLLTLTDEPGRLRVPNLVVKKLLLDRLLEVFLAAPGESYEARRAALGFFDRGDLRPLLDFFEDKLFPILSNRDQGRLPRQAGQAGGGVNEMTLKALFLAILFDDQRFVVHSELELERGYADLCLLVRPESRHPNPFDIVFELKMVRRKTLGKRGEELRSMDEETLRDLPAVKTALAEARGQAARYREGLTRRLGGRVPQRAYAIVAVGLERLVGEEVPTGPHPSQP